MRNAREQPKYTPTPRTKLMPSSHQSKHNEQLCPPAWDFPRIKEHELYAGKARVCHQRRNERGGIKQDARAIKIGIKIRIIIFKDTVGLQSDTPVNNSKNDSDPTAEIPAFCARIQTQMNN